ncbi:MAG: sodium:proton antiporter [Prevotella sp.]|jgi:Na+/H+ antiporter NhaD/arsenite permease-like protein|nr:sodium:proton antiporter [Prevotella sp.]
MTLIIVAILLLSFVLIATEHITNVNKAAVAIFAGTVGWVLYICYGTDFVMSEHQGEYVGFLNGAVATSTAVKQYIAQNIFLKYVGRAAEIVLFLLATMTIVEILNNNGCFDFLTPMVRTRHSRRMLWALTTVTFIISANLDNLTTTSLMLVVTRNLVSEHRARFIYGSAVVVAANAGGAMTVIGDPAGVVLWNMGAVTATNFSMSLLLPCLIAWALPTYLLSRSLPERVTIAWKPMPFRGDDTNLNVWQRALMLFVGIGGLWFIPTFHNITKLSPFLGALCVLSVLWIVNEIFNHRLYNVNKMTERRMPQALQYGVLQMILYVMGMMLAVGVVEETGAVRWLADRCDAYIHNVWVMGALAGLVSSSLDNFATALSFFSLHSVEEVIPTGDAYQAAFATNGCYWKVIAYCAALTGNVLAIGSMSGVALLKMERMPLMWYLKNVGIKALVGWAMGLLVMVFIAQWL